MTLPGRRADGQIDLWPVRLKADWYPAWPPQVTFVEPDGVNEPAPGSPWLPVFVGPPPMQFGFHQTYSYTDPVDQTPLTSRQLVCFSHSFDFYISNHVAQPSEQWDPRTHNVAATLNRLRQLLGAPHYQGPAAPREAQAA